MLEARSPLGANARSEVPGVVLSEVTGFTLTQVAGDEKTIKKSLRKISGREVLKVAPRQYWVIGEAPQRAEGLYLTPLSSSRCCIELEGSKSRDVLAACAAIDFSPSQFKPGAFVMTGIHHTPVLIQCRGENTFHIYALRTFAMNVWEWLCDVASGLEHNHA